MRDTSLIRPIVTVCSLSINPTLIQFTEKRQRIINEISRRWSHVHYTYPMIESPVMPLLRLFDKIDPNQSKLDSKFNQDFGLDSLDIVEITAALEDEFLGRNSLHRDILFNIHVTNMMSINMLNPYPLKKNISNDFFSFLVVLLINPSFFEKDFFSMNLERLNDSFCSRCI